MLRVCGLIIQDSAEHRWSLDKFFGRSLASSHATAQAPCPFIPDGVRQCPVLGNGLPVLGADLVDLHKLAIFDQAFPRAGAVDYEPTAFRAIEIGYDSVQDDSVVQFRHGLALRSL